MSLGRSKRHRVMGTRVLAIIFLTLPGLLIGMPAKAAAPDSAPRTDFWMTDGTVVAVARAQGRLFVGGNFDYAGPLTGKASALDKVTGAPAAAFAKANGEVLAVEPDGLGGWFLGGAFLAFEGTYHPYLAHILADGTLDPSWNAKPNLEVRRLALIGSTLYIAGSFSTVDGQFRLYLAAVDATTGTLLPWDPSPTSNVSTIERDGTTLYVSGSFDSIAGEARYRGASFDGLSGAITTWQLPATVPGSVVDMAFSDSLVYLAGDFPSVGGAARNSLAAVRKSDGSLSPWAPSVKVTGGGTPQLYSLALVNNTLYAGGDFDSVGGAWHRNLAAIDPGTGAALSWTQNAIGTEANALLASGGLLYVGFRGLMTAPVTRSGIAALRLDNGNFEGFGPLVEEAAAVYALAEDATRLVIGGNFSSVGGVLRRNLAVLDEATGAAFAWDPRPHGIVEDIAVSADSQTVFIVGPYDSIGGAFRRGGASFDVASGALGSFTPAAVASNTEEVLLSGSEIYLAGQSAVAALNSAGAILWQPTVNNVVTGVAVAGDTVYITGRFTTVQGQSRRGLAALLRSTGALLDWNPAGTGSTLRLEDVEVVGSTVYVSGESMGTMGGAGRSYIAAIDRFTGLATSFNPVIPVASGQSVLEILIDGNTLYAAGQFAAGPNRDLAAWNLATSARLSWNPLSNDNYAEDIVKSDSVMYVGGQMRSFGTNPDGSAGRYYIPNLAAFRIDAIAPSAATSLTATPHPSITKRIDLAWTASPSPDVANYLIYRDTATIADTTGKRIATLGLVTTYPDVTPLATTYYYRVFAMDAAGNISASSNEASALSPDYATGVGGSLAVTSLRQNAPNPFAGSTRLDFTLAADGPVRLAVFDVAGRRVALLNDGELPAGRHAFAWDGTDDQGRAVARGLYFARLDGEGFTRTVKMSLAR